MDPILLTFKSRSLERDYEAHVARNGALTTDRMSIRLIAIVSGVAFLRYVRLGDSKFFGVAALIAFLHASVMLMRRRRASEEKVIEKREAHAVVHRFVAISMHMCGSLFDHSMATNLPGYIMRSGFILSIMTPNLKLKFKHHVVCHTVCTLAMLYFTAKTTCTTVVKAHEDHPIIPIANFLDRLARVIMFVKGIEAPNVHMTYGCMHVSVWIHLYLILVGSSYVVWMKERHIRIAFVKSILNKRDVKVEGHGDLKNLDYIPSWMLLLHLGLLATFFAVTWLWSYPLTSLLDSWGLLMV